MGQQVNKKLKKFAIPEINAWIFAENQEQFEIKKHRLLNRDVKYNSGSITFNPRVKKKK